MRRILRTLAILTLLGCGSYAVYRLEHVPKPRVTIPVTRYHGYELNHLAIERARQFTVLISNEGFGGIGRGTGILIDATHVLTCAHMLEGPHDDMWIYPYPGRQVVKGHPVFVSESSDLAVLELDRIVVIPHYAIFMDMHYDGEPITIIGNTLGSMRWFITFGLISGEWEKFLLTDGVLYGGNSGGPWINEQGEVVAITDWTLVASNGTESNIHGGVSAKAVLAFLKNWQDSTKARNIIIQMLMGGN